jgi:N-hydroxyarylamine O-acetyltransferase
MVSVPDYLVRIGYRGATMPDAENLRNLHRAHLLSVPFENLDIGLKREIVCETEPVLRKIVELRRGGFCYELNGAFAWLLRELGFRVTLLSARVARQDGTFGPEFDHLTLRVDLDEPWLADVGFGDSFVEPLRLEPGIEQEQARGKFRIRQQEDGEREALDMERFDTVDGWRPQYRFSTVARELGDFARMCRHHQTSPDSHFTRNRICSRATEHGRVTLSGLRLITTEPWNKEERDLSEEELAPVLERHFGVRL